MRISSRRNIKAHGRMKRRVDLMREDKTQNFEVHVAGEDKPEAVELVVNVVGKDHAGEARVATVEFNALETKAIIHVIASSVRAREAMLTAICEVVPKGY